MKKIALLIVVLLALSLLCACFQGRIQLYQDSLAQLEVAEENDSNDVCTSQLASRSAEEVEAQLEMVKQSMNRNIVKRVEEMLLQKKALSIPTDSIEVELNEYGLELPINGATGYTSTSMPLYGNSMKENVVTTLEAGTAFKILSEESDMWLVSVNDTTGWLEHRYCFINLPDVIPSMIYDNTNSYSSMYRSVGYPMEGITGEVLYDSTAYNARFDKTQYLMPVLYQMSKKICLAQNEALKNGHCLKLYEGYRPFDTQTKICSALGKLITENSEVYQHVCSYPWGKGFFISTGLSYHQLGCAIDISLVDISSAIHKNCGNYSYVCVTKYEEFEMPTAMHELSNLAVTFSYPVTTLSKTAWETAILSPSMTDGAINLQKYCTTGGLTPLSSEWWHFNDLDAIESVAQRMGVGNFFVTESCSEIPE